MSLFMSYKLASLALNNRIVMAPMTRARTTQPGNIPNDLMAQYYAQRASAGLIITEATQISDDSQGYSFTPGVYTAEQIEGWKKVTAAVHQAGGKIFNQIWHVGRVSHPIFQQGNTPIAPSAIAPVGTKVWIVDEAHPEGQMVDCPEPKVMVQADIDRVVADFAQAGVNAVAAGFDGIEIHGGNGYLIDQFLRTNSNHRTDAYGGSQENRIRFLLEIVQAVSAKIGANKVGVRLAPYVTFKDMACPEIVDTILLAAKHLSALGVAYLHLSEADWDDAPQVPESFRVELRKVFKGSIIVAGRYDVARANEVIDNGYADLVAFGRPFIANPDLPYRLMHQLPLSAFDKGPLFGGCGVGYTDYPTHNEALRAVIRSADDEVA
ncbi:MULTISPECIES: alkene reductase [unclassified Shewanella]|uniref:alkene reductase n=1 Tax=Shewanella TaxID=22 RepID=UPI0021D95758|nr:MULTISPECIES: alkene reductase [unclassified Shewanella]MCU8021373.1 alkene reductase [Shewanella sp. SM78]MCU8043389.1 alkene reductase [Shewanella sp. SM68]MCU8048651.1 alkene reductase [Shewanella sp. SM65]MCU8078597.1 alkene reductase [Shewanella sp. SM103]